MKKNENSNILNKSSKICKTIVILGTAETGKTNILQRYTKHRFEENYIETIGVDYFSKNIVSHYGNIVLSIWDTCGSETELKILPSNVYKVASAYIIVCSYDKKESFDTLKSWIDHIQCYLNMNNRNNLGSTSPLIPVVILINKCDIKKDRKFKITEVISLINEFTLNILVYEVSAKENNKLEYVFDKIVGIMSGMISIANEATINNSNNDNTTYLEEGEHNSNSFVRSGKRKKSFQLKQPMKEIKGFDRDKFKNGSCACK